MHLSVVSLILVAVLVARILFAVVRRRDRS